MRLVSAAAGAMLLVTACGGSAATASAHVQGTLLAEDGQTWLVENNLVVLPASTPADGAAPGAQVAVDGTWGSAGQLLAARVQVVQPAPTPVPAAAPTAPAPPTAARAAEAPPARGKPEHEGEHGGRQKH